MSAETSTQRLEACLPYIFQGEGGYTTIRSDPGNWTGGKVGVGTLKGTNFGISAAAYPKLDIKGLTKAGAAAIYRRDYWDQAGCHTLPAGPDLPIFDVSVNSGPGRAVKFRTATAGSAEPVARIKAISAKRRAFYQGLSTFKTFGKGWMARVAKIEAAAIKMALAAKGAAPFAVKEKLLAEAKVSTAKVQTASTGSAGAVATSGAVSWTAADWATLGICSAVTVACIVVAFHFVRAHHERAEAFEAEAEV